MEIGWIHFSENNRKDAAKLAENFDTNESNDLLGLKADISNFSNYFFPGIVSGQTRARYYMFGLYLLKMTKPDGEIKDLHEFKLKEKKICQKLPEETGVGVQGNRALKKNKNDWLVITPTEKYWTGIKKFFLREEFQDLSLSQMVEYLQQKGENSIFKDTKHFPENDYKEFVKKIKSKKNIEIECTNDEKKFIRGAMKSATDGTLLCKLINDLNKLPESFCKIDYEKDTRFLNAKKFSKIIECMCRCANNEDYKGELEVMKNENLKEKEFIEDFIKTNNRKEIIKNRIMSIQNKQCKSFDKKAMINYDSSFRYNIVRSILSDLK